MVVVTGSGFTLNSGSNINSLANRSANERPKLERRPTPEQFNQTEKSEHPVTSGLDDRSTSYLYFIASLRAQNSAQIDYDATNTQQASPQTFLPANDFASEFDKELQQLNADVGTFDASFQSSESLDITAVQLQTDDGIQAFAASIDFQLHASLSATLTMQDGSTISVEAEIELDLEFDIAVLTQQNSQRNANQSDPLALDTDGDGQISLTDERTGPVFDINADSRVDRTSFVTGGDVFLALDRNRDGQINNGAELFGDQRGAENGFLELGRLDENGDGRVDSADSLFSQLRGVRSEAGVLRQYSLEELGVGSISLSNQTVNQAVGAGNVLAQRGSYTTTTGETRLAADMLLRYQSLSALV